MSDYWAHGCAKLFAEHGEALPVQIPEGLRDQLGEGDVFTVESMPGCTFVAVHGEVTYTQRQLDIINADAQRQRGVHAG